MGFDRTPSDSRDGHPGVQAVRQLRGRGAGREGGGPSYGTDIFAAVDRSARSEVQLVSLLPDMVDVRRSEPDDVGHQGQEHRPRNDRFERRYIAGDLGTDFTVRVLPGRPDMVFPSRDAVIFVHGCFWHGHDCRYFKIPATRTEFWRANYAGQSGTRPAEPGSASRRGMAGGGRVGVRHTQGF